MKIITFGSDLSRRTAEEYIKMFEDSELISSVYFNRADTFVENYLEDEEERNRRIKKALEEVKVFPVEVYLNERSKILLPGMTVSLKIAVNKLNNELYIPLEALFKKDGVDFVISANEKLKEFKIYDASGKLMGQKSLAQKEYRFSSQDLKSGLYIINVFTANQRVSKKVIK